MSGGIAILLLLIIAVVGAALFIAYSGGIQGLRHRPGGDLNPRPGESRPTHRVAEPTDEHVVGFGVSGEHGDTPRPARVPRGS
jgi:hypothetical protein